MPTDIKTLNYITAKTMRLKSIRIHLTNTKYKISSGLSL